MFPVSPYAIAKLYAFHAARTYRSSYSMFVSNGILFNHESERRGEEFVTRKITLWAASLAAGRPYTLRLGDTTARRDWGYAPDYVDLMWRILQHGRADDFVGATGEAHSVADFYFAALEALGVNSTVASTHYESSVPELGRPAEVHELRGDAWKARQELGWEPAVRFGELVRRMVAADYARVSGRPPLIAARPTGS